MQTREQWPKEIRNPSEPAFTKEGIKTFNGNNVDPKIVDISDSMSSVSLLKYKKAHDITAISAFYQIE